MKEVSGCGIENIIPKDGWKLWKNWAMQPELEDMMIIPDLKDDISILEPDLLALNASSFYPLWFRK